ncbi:MAG: hypothetical protein V1774_11765, partial [Candidatus Eisenbacteria bacterium]
LGTWACLGVVPALLAGCGMGAPSSPDEFRAPWDSLQLFSVLVSDTLAVLGDGTLDYRADTLAASGLISEGSLRVLENALGGAQLEPWDASGPPVGAVGWVISAQGARTLGFSWEADAQLSEPRRRMVDLLDEIRCKARSQALGEGNERVELIGTSVVLRGERSRLDQRSARVIRDADALLQVVRECLGGDPVIMPEVDFESEILLAVFAGRQAAGAEIHVDGLASRTVGGFLLVPVTVYAPAPGCAALGESSPFEIVRLRKVDLEVFFQWAVENGDCPTEERARPFGQANRLGASLSIEVVTD